MDFCWSMDTGLSMKHLNLRILTAPKEPGEALNSRITCEMGLSSTAGRELNRDWTISWRILPDEARPSLILNSILDWPATQIMFRQTYQYMMETFWARFGWGHVPLRWPAAYQVLNWIFLLGLLAAIIGTIRHIRGSSWDWVILIFLSAGLIWFADLVRGVGYFTSNDLYIPPSRYAFPAIIPIAVILCFGWYEIARMIGFGMNRLFKPGNAPSEDQESGRKSPAKFLPVGLFIGALVLLAVISLLSYHFYNNIDKEMAETSN
jgi:hypothetical protein